MSRPKIYLAGPDVFLPDAVAVGRAKRAICDRHGLDGIYPLDGERPGEAAAGPEAGFAIAAANEAKMRACDVIVANLSPFRGPSADPGTAYELGFMRALGRPCFGYTNDPRPLVARIEAFIGEPLGRLPDGRLVAADGLVAESFGLSDNLMLHEAVGLDGLFVAPEPGLAASAAFEQCIAQAALRLAAGASFRLRGASGVFTVSDVTQALDFYVGRMGFAEEFRVGDPPSYASVERGPVSLQLMPAARAPATLGRSSVYVFVRGVDALHADLLARGCPIELPPTDLPYGMREASVRDPDGNRLTFGEPVAG